MRTTVVAMVRGSKFLTSGLLAGVLLGGALARAQDDSYGEEESFEGEASTEGNWMGDSVEVDAEDLSTTDSAPYYQVAYTRRPLTIRRFMIRGDAGLGIERFPDVAGVDIDPLVTLDIGGAFGVFDELEVGVSRYRVGTSMIANGEVGRPLGQGLIPLIFSPDFDFGDIPVYGRYQFFQNDMFEIAGDVVLVIPSNTDFAFHLGVPVRIHVLEDLAIDTGIEFRATFFDGPGTDTTLGIPVRATYNITENFFAGGVTGVQAIDFDGDRTAIPLGVHGGYTLVKNDRPLLDLMGEFTWPAFLVPGSPGDKAPTGLFAFLVSASFYYSL